MEFWRSCRYVGRRGCQVAPLAQGVDMHGDHHDCGGIQDVQLSPAPLDVVNSNQALDCRVDVARTCCQVHVGIGLVQNRRPAHTIIGGGPDLAGGATDL